MDCNLLPRRGALCDALGAEEDTARAGFKLRNHLVIRPGSLADIEIIAWGDSDNMVCGPRRRCRRLGSI
jgi:hypothetical protein